MIRICSAKTNENLNDITISHNIITDSFYKANFTVIGIMINEKDETISKQLKEYNCYYYDNHKGKLEKYLKQFMVRNIIIALDLNNIKSIKDIKKYIKILKRIGKICNR